MDQARIIRFLIHNVSFPKGISPDNPTLNFSLEKQDLNSLTEIIKTFQAYNNFGMQDLLNIIGNMGFTKNPYAENYLLRIDNKDYKQLIRNICYTHSYSTRDQKKI